MKSRKIVFIVALMLGFGCDSVEQSDSDFMKKGVDLYSKGEYAKAELELKNAIQKNPDTADSYYYMALLNEKSRNFKAMRANLLEAVKLNPENLDARVKLAKIQLLFNDLEKALAEVKAILSRQKDNLAALTVQAQILEKQEKTDDAMDLVNEVLSKNPDYLDALALKAVILMKKQAYDKALAVIEQGLGIDQKNISFYLLKIQIQSRQKDIPAVIKDYLALAKIQPDNDAIKYALVRAYFNNGEKLKAESVLTRLIKDKPKDIKAKLIYLGFLAASDRNAAFEQLQKFLSGSQAGDKIEFAKWALLNNNTGLANRILNKIVDAEADSQQKQTALLLLASISFQQKDYQQAAKLVEKTLQINSDNVDAKTLRAAILLSTGKTAEAEQLLKNILWEKPDSDKSMVLLAQIYLDRGETGKANSEFKNALKINPANLQALLPIVNEEIHKKHNDYAKELLKKALSKGGIRLDLMQMLVKLELADRNWKAAEKLIKMIKVQKNGQLLGQFLTAQSLAQQKECQKAIEIYQQILERYPWQNASLTAMAVCYEQLKSRTKMVSYLDQLIEKNPDIIPAYLLKSRLLVLDGKPNQAINLLKQTLAKNGVLAAVYRELARLYLQQGNKAAALDSFQQGLQKYPDDLGLLMTMASFDEQQHQYDKAIELYHHILQIAPGLDVAKNNLASLLLEQGSATEIEQAKELVKKFKESDQPYFLDTFAWTQFKSGNLEDALTALRKVIIAAPDIPVFRYHLARVYDQQKDHSGAIMELRQALELGKKTPFAEDKSAREMLDELVKK